MIDDAVRYAGEREQFGQPIGKFQAIAHLLADLQVEVDAARWLLYRAAWIVDAGERCIKEASMANLACTEALLRVTEEGMRGLWGLRPSPWSSISSVTFAMPGCIRDR